MVFIYSSALWRKRDNNNPPLRWEVLFMVPPRRLSENSNFLSDRGKLEKIAGGI